MRIPAYLIYDETGKIVFDQEYFKVDEDYIVSREMRMMTLKENNGSSLIFQDKHNDSVYVVSAASHLCNVTFGNKYNGIIDEAIKDHMHGENFIYSEKPRWDNIIYRVGYFVDDFFMPEMNIFSNDIKEQNLLFFSGNMYGVLKAKYCDERHVLMSKIGGTDVSTYIWSPEDLLRNCKCCKRVVYDGETFVDMTDTDISKIVVKTKTFNVDKYHDKAMIIYSSDSGGGYFKRPDDSMRLTYLFARNTVNMDKPFLVNDVMSARELITPEMISIEMSKILSQGGKPLA